MYIKVIFFHFTEITFQFSCRVGKKSKTLLQLSILFRVVNDKTVTHIY